MPVVLDPHTYGTEWVKWWTAAQPQERDTKEWPFARNTDHSIDWRRFPANGKDGIFIAIMALSWWALALRSPDELALFEEAATDIHWVIQELIRTKMALQDSPSNLPPPQVEPDHTPYPQPSPVPPPSPPPVSTSNAPFRERASGKRVVKPTWKAKAVL